MRPSWLMVAFHLLYCVILPSVVGGFTRDQLLIRPTNGRFAKTLLLSSPQHQNDDEQQQPPPPQLPHRHPSLSRRDVLSSVLLGGSLSVSLLIPTCNPSWAAVADVVDSVYRPAKRPTAYFVDSTIPPTLIPLGTARQQIQILENLGRGLGTPKESVTDDRINLNNMLNKAVFGTADRISSIMSPSETGPTFVCLGMPSSMTPSSADVDLAIQLSNIILRARRSGGSSSSSGTNAFTNTAIGLAFCPWSVQTALDQYVGNNGKEENELVSALQQVGVTDATINLYLPLLQWAQREHVKLLALAPEPEDVAVARREGLQNVDPNRRLAYVPDAQGFIGLSQDPQFRLYTERALLKDFDGDDDGDVPSKNRDDSPAKFFAERILVHETAATALAQFAVSSTPSKNNKDALVIVVAPTPDVRYLGGINRRLPRLVQYLDAQATIAPNAVTTILLNPTAKETLSKSRYLRLEIGTGPETLDYQAKVADYLWFSKTPKVNLIPRLMDY